VIAFYKSTFTYLLTYGNEMGRGMGKERDVRNATLTVSTCTTAGGD